MSIEVKKETDIKKMINFASLILKLIVMGNVPEILNVLVITISDRASRGEYKDLCGPAINYWRRIL